MHIHICLHAHKTAVKTSQHNQEKKDFLFFLIILDIFCFRKRETEETMAVEKKDENVKEYILWF